MAVGKPFWPRLALRSRSPGRSMSQQIAVAELMPTGFGRGFQIRQQLAQAQGRAVLHGHTVLEEERHVCRYDETARGLASGDGIELVLADVPLLIEPHIADVQRRVGGRRWRHCVDGSHLRTRTVAIESDPPPKRQRIESSDDSGCEKEHTRSVLGEDDAAMGGGR